MSLLFDRVSHLQFDQVGFAEDEVAGFATLRACPACTSEAAPRPLAEIGPSRWAKRVRLVECTGCQLVYYANPPPQRFMDRYYEETWDRTKREAWQAHTPVVPVATSTDSLRLITEFGIEDRNVCILDVGCGVGAELAGLAAAGFGHVYGTEASAHRVRISSARFPRRITSGGYAAIPSDRRFDVIVSSHVFEHLSTPREAFALAARRLSDAGVIVLTVPHASFEPVFNQAIFLPHLHSFSVDAMMRMGASADFSCLFWKGARPWELAAVYFRDAAQAARAAPDRFCTASALGGGRRVSNDARIGQAFDAASAGFAGLYATYRSKDPKIRRAGFHRLNRREVFERQLAWSLGGMLEATPLARTRERLLRHMGVMRILPDTSDPGGRSISHVTDRAVFLVK